MSHPHQPDISTLVEAVRKAPIDLSQQTRDKLVEELQNPESGEAELRAHLQSLPYTDPLRNYEWFVADYVMIHHFVPLLRAREVSPLVAHDLHRFVYQMLGGAGNVEYETVSDDRVAEALESRQ